MRVLVAALLLALSLPASAQMLATLRVEPTDITVGVGETVFVKVYGMIGCCSKFPWYVTFGASSPHATVLGTLEYPKVETTLRVTGNVPGETTIRSSFLSGSVPMAKVHVVCRGEPPIAPPLTPIAVTRPDQPVTLTVAADIPPDSFFFWYRGRVGDTSQPIPMIGPAIDMVPGAYGTHYVWVSAVSACSITTAEFRIDVVRLRRRAAR